MGFPLITHPAPLQRSAAGRPYGASGNDNLPRFEHQAIAQNQAGWMPFHLHETIDERT